MNKIIYFVISSSISLTALSNSLSTIPFTIGSLRNKRNPTAIQSVANKIEIYELSCSPDPTTNSETTNHDFSNQSECFWRKSDKKQPNKTCEICSDWSEHPWKFRFVFSKFVLDLWWGRIYTIIHYCTCALLCIVY